MLQPIIVFAIFLGIGILFLINVEWISGISASWLEGLSQGKYAKSLKKFPRIFVTLGSIITIMLSSIGLLNILANNLGALFAIIVAISSIILLVTVNYITKEILKKKLKGKK